MSQLLTLKVLAGNNQLKRNFFRLSLQHKEVKTKVSQLQTRISQLENEQIDLLDTYVAGQDRRQDLEAGDTVAQLKQENADLKQKLEAMEKAEQGSATDENLHAVYESVEKRNATPDEYVGVDDSSDVEEEYMEEEVDIAEIEDFLPAPDSPGDTTEGGEVSEPESDKGIAPAKKSRSSDVRVSGAKDQRPIVMENENATAEEDEDTVVHSRRRAISIEDLDDEEDEGPIADPHLSKYNARQKKASQSMSRLPSSSLEDASADQVEDNAADESNSATSIQSYGGNDGDLAADDPAIDSPLGVNAAWEEIFAEFSMKVQMDIAKSTAEQNTKIEELEAKIKSLERAAIPALPSVAEDEGAIDDASGHETTYQASSLNPNHAVSQGAIADIEQVSYKKKHASAAQPEFLRGTPGDPIADVCTQQYTPKFEANKISQDSSVTKESRLELQERGSLDLSALEALDTIGNLGVSETFGGSASNSALKRNADAQMGERKRKVPKISRDMKLNILNICVDHQRGACCRLMHWNQGQVERLLEPIFDPRPLKSIPGKQVADTLKQEGVCPIYYLGHCCKHPHMSEEEADKRIEQGHARIARHIRLS